MHLMTTCGGTLEELCQWGKMGVDRKSVYREKKLNTKISAEAELMRADNAMPQIIWTR